MDFTFSEEQQGLRQVVRRLAQDHAAPIEPPGSSSLGHRRESRLWRAATRDLGLLAIGIGEDRYGAGGGFVDAAVAIEEAGAALLPVPLTTGLVAGSVLERCGDVAAVTATAQASGERLAVVAAADSLAVAGDRLSGVAPHVIDGDVADVLVVAGGDGLWLVDSDGSGVDVRVLPPVDLTRGQAAVQLADAPATRVGDAADADAAVDLLRVALAVEAVGAARHCLDVVVAHLSTREQFGRPIGSFQALQHRAADLVVLLEASASTAYYAAWAAAESPDELPVVAPLAKSYCCDAAWRIAADMIQLLGGIGITWEHPAHLYLRRALSTRLLLGDAPEQRRLVAARAGLFATGA